MLLPIGVEDAPAGRFPRATAVLAALCVVVFAGQALGAFGPEEGLQRAGEAAEDALTRHPYLLPADPGALSLVPPGLQVRLREERARRERTGTLPPAEALEREQRQLDEAFATYVRELRTSSWRRFSFVPARGAGQPGWVTAIFLHGNGWHIAGNLLFFLVTAPLVEDVLGGIAFALFFVLGGVAANLLQFAADPASPLPNLGASGAIAAVMGAFTFRHARERIRVFSPLFFWRGVVPFPAWIAGGAWFGREAWSFTHGGVAGVAVGAHVGGFAFGLAVAAAVRALGFEKHLVRPLSEGEAWRASPSLKRAREALAAGREEEAREAFSEVLATEPQHREALDAMFAFALQGRDAAALTRYAERLFLRHFAANDEAAVHDLLVQVARRLDPALLRPAFVLKLARACEAVDSEGALALYAAAAAGGGAAGARAQAARAELAFRLGRAALAREAARALAAEPEAMAQEKARAAEILAALDSAELRDAALSSAHAPALAAMLAGRDARGLVAEADGVRFSLAPQEIRAVAAAVAGRVLVVDLRLANGRRLRFSSERMGLASVFPAGTPPAEAVSAVLSELLSGGAAAWPDREALATRRFPRMSSIEEFEAAVVRAA